MKPILLGLIASSAIACGVASSEDVDSRGDNIETVAAAPCTDATRPQVWANIIKEPIRPPRSAAGLDFSGGHGGWAGLQREKAETALCAGQSPAELDGETTMSWGDYGELSMTFSNAWGRATFVSFNAGYEGKVNFHSRVGSRFGDHSYELGVGVPLLRDGLPFELSWNDRAKRAEQATELHDALVATFVPELPPDDVNCIANQHCVANKLSSSEGVDAFFGSRTVHMYFTVDQPDAPTMAGVPTMMYMFPDAPSVLPSPPTTSHAPVH